MNIWKLVIENPSLAKLCEQFPHLRRYLVEGFETNVKRHATDVVGLDNPKTGQALRVHLITGDLLPA